MASIIDYTIGPRQFEQIEVRLGEVLTDELVEQATRNLDTDLNPSIFLERVIPIDKAEVKNQPLINIQLSRGSYDNFKNLVKDGTYTFFIDCYAAAPSDNAEDGDALARKKIQRLFGVIDAILSNPIYNTLAFAKPSISRCEVIEMLFPDAQEYINAPHLLMGRLVYTVRVPESVQEKPLTTIEEWSTQVKLYDTDKGYLFTGETPVIPPPPACDPATVQNSDGSFTYEIASGDTYITPDINITVNGSGFLSIPSIKDQDIILKNTFGDIITPAGVTNNEIIIEINPGTCSDLVYNRPPWSGQTVSYNNYDAGWHFANGSYNYGEEKGILQRLDDSNSQMFSTLIYNNDFGNKNRFTDENGLQDYGNGIVIDHLTGIMWSLSDNGTAETWFNSLTLAESSNLGGFNDWRIPTAKEYITILDFQNSNGGLNYPPFNYNGNGVAVWTNESVTKNLAFAYVVYDNIAPIISNQLVINLNRVDKNFLRKYFIIRKHY